MQDVSLFDIVVISATLLLGLKGLFRGFLKEFFGLVGIIGGIFVASRLADVVGNKIAPFFALENGASIQLMGFIVSLLIFWVIAYLIGAILSKMFSLSGLGIFDRIFGFLFGSFKIFLIFSIIIYALVQIQTIKEKLDSSIGNTITYPILIAGGSYIIKLDENIPSAQIKERLDSAIDSTKNTIEDISIDTAKDMVDDLIEDGTNKIEEKLNGTSEEMPKEDSSTSNNQNNSETPVDNANSETQEQEINSSTMQNQ